MVEESRDEEEVVADHGDGDGKEKPWYPYITKTQFEKFLSRLQSKIPDEIDRDYVRAIIRTPSMIYRFLRGVEAMGLIDAEQRPTDRLRSLVEKDTRKQALGEVVHDLYPSLLQKMQETEGEMADRDIVTFFRNETGMGNDSANKMKMFFKYLLSEAGENANNGAPVAAAEEAGSDKADEVVEDKAEEHTGDVVAREAEPEAEEPAPQVERGRSAQTRSQRGGNDRNERGGSPDHSGRGEREDRPTRGDRGGRGEQREERPERGDRNDHGGRGEREDRPERGGRGGRGGRNDRNDREERGERDAERVPSNRPLTEAQQAYLDTLKSVLRVSVDGDWDDDMIRLAFDRLERLFDRIRRG